MASTRTALQSAATVVGPSKAETRCWAESTLDDLHAFSRQTGIKRPGRPAPRRRAELLEVPMPNSAASGHGSDTDSTGGSRPSSSASKGAPRRSAHDIDIGATMGQLTTGFSLNEQSRVASMSMPDLHRDATASCPSSKGFNASVRLAPLRRKGKSGSRHAAGGDHACTWPLSNEGRLEWRLGVASETPLKLRSRSRGGTTPVGLSRKFGDFSREADSRRVGSLARKYRLPLEEVKRISDAVSSMKTNAHGQASEDEFRRCLCSALDVAEVVEDVWQDARSMFTSRHELNLDDVVSWYVQNMFKHVNGLRGAEDRCASDALVYKLAHKLGTKTGTIDRIKAEFDRFDRDGDGAIDREEFGRMMCFIFHAEAGDFSESRSSHYWNEIDTNSDGTIDFSEFCKWHLKYFNPNGLSSNLLSSFYDSYQPDVQRRNCLRNIATSTKESRD